MNNDEYDEKLASEISKQVMQIINAMQRGHTCQSPIELAFLRAFLFVVVFQENQSVSVNGQTPGIPWQIQTQAVVGPYKADFLIEGPISKQKFVVECDGHDFHEKTKKQAARDKARDRYFASCGYIVLRFTGAEIWKSAYACADEVFAQFLSALHREGRSEEDGRD